MASALVADATVEAFQRDGVVHIPGALESRWLDLLRTTHQRQMAGGARSGQLWCWKDFPAYLEVARDSDLPELVGRLMGSDDVWFMYDQVFHKRPGASAVRTPWHQDSSYLCVDGSQLAVVWITLNDLPAAESLEFVRGSHRGRLYNGYSYDPKEIAEDETAPLFKRGDLPRLPAIEKDRTAWDIVSFDITPGDVVVFHPSMLHGGAPITASAERRTVTLRFFGDDAVYASRPAKVGPPIPELHAALGPGDPFRWTDDWFPKLR